MKKNRVSKQETVKTLNGKEHSNLTVNTFQRDRKETFHLET